MYETSFVILNYNSFDVLNECIESIKKYCINYYIVIVDNGSQLKDWQKLQIFKDDINFHLIRSEKNLGFAKGNNLGFRYIRENIKCNFIAMINSDTLILNSDFQHMINIAFEKYSFAVLGPDILPNHSNPMVNELNSVSKIKKMIRKCKRELVILKTPLLNYLFIFFRKIAWNLIKRKKAIIDYPLINCQLHGCFWVFSNLYTLNGLCDDTFLYGEEDILAKQCRDNNLLMLYYPDLKIIHNESVATKKTIPNRIQRNIFFLKNSIDSYKVLLKLYRK